MSQVWNVNLQSFLYSTPTDLIQKHVNLTEYTGGKKGISSLSSSLSQQTD